MGRRSARRSRSLVLAGRRPPVAPHRRPPADRGRAGHPHGRGRVPAAVARGRGAMMAAGSDPAAVPAAVVTPQPAPHPPARLRTVLRLARAESAMLGRSPLVLAGLIAGAVLIWILMEALQPLWWRASWDIGSGQVVL